MQKNQSQDPRCRWMEIQKNRVYVFGIGNKFFQQFGEVLSGILAGLMAESIVVEIPHNGLLA